MLKALRSSSHHTQNAKKNVKLWFGPGTHEIPIELFVNNRDRLVTKLAPKVTGKTIVVLKGGEEKPIYDTDIEYVFRQEAFFMWAFGVEDPGCFGMIDISNKTSYLFVPRQPNSYRIWRGPVLTPDDYIRKYGIHNANFVDEMIMVLKSLNPTVLLTLRGINSDSNLVSTEARFPGIDKFQINNKILYDVMADLRVFKTDMEIAVLKYVNDVSAEAHCKLMRFTKPGKTEYQCEAEFLHYCYATGGCRHASSTPSCASGSNTAYPHYGRPVASISKIIDPEDLCVFHMGVSYFGYCSDMACTFPASGKFTTKQKVVYEAVLQTGTSVFQQLKPGVCWKDMHLLAHRVLLSELKKAGLLKGDVDQMVEVGLGVIFLPHGIGHFLGLNVHDVGGFIGTKRGDLKTTANLRTTRVLEEKMVLALAPACYFNDYLLNEALGNGVLARFLNQDVIRKFRGMGGVKIVDEIVIQKDGAIYLTKVPRTVKEVEEFMAGKDSKKYGIIN